MDGFGAGLVDIKQRLQLDDQLPLLVGNILAVKLLETVDTGARDHTVEAVRLLEVAAVNGLVTAHFDLDGNRGLSLLADGELLVVTLDGGAA
jgi:hypothetical protein